MTAVGAGDVPLPLLGTKLRPPRRRRATVERGRLADPGVADTGPALTLVSAPAGFGKTTLVSEWLTSARTAWLGLDPGDDEPTRFWTYVVAALEEALPDLGSESGSLLRDPRLPIDVALATLINDVEAAATDVVLVLDDYHVIQDPRIHASVSFLLDHLPAQLRLVIATRADPPLPLASMRAAGELREVRAADLRFTAEEAAEYLNGAMGLSLTPGDVEVLGSRTEGWIAALQLAALSIQGRSDPDQFIAEFAGEDRFILDYLADEVLDRQPPGVRDFLLDTSILGRLSGPLCAAVTGDEHARGRLDELDRANLFVVALDDRRGWYRYHHLFGDMLRARLLDERPERVPELHRRASEWYAANDLPQGAVEHALAGGDVERAASLIERAAPALTRARQEALLRSWLERLPDEVYDDRPVLSILLVGARMSTGDATRVTSLLERAERWLDADGSPIVVDEVEYRRLPATIAMYRAGLALLAGDVDATMRHANRVLDLVGPSDQLQHGAAAALLGLAHWYQGELEPAAGRYSESIACFEDGDFLADVMGCSLALADIRITQGRLDDAQRTFESALGHTADHPGLRGAADMHVGCSLLATERNDLVAAAEHLGEAADLGEHLGLPQHPYRWRVATAWLRRAEGDLDAALDLLEEAEGRYDTDFSPPVRPVAALKAQVQLERGDHAAALGWAHAHPLGIDDECTYVHEFEHLTMARVLLAAGSVDEIDRAMSALDRLLASADIGQRTGSSIQILVTQALGHLRAGRSAEATAAVSEALRRADGRGYVRTFLDVGPPLAELLRGLDGPSGEHARRLLVTEPPEGAPRRSRVAGPDELSERELEVLRLLRSDLSGPDIARGLHVSLNTLRTHTKHIYTKLGVTNRREAVSRANELGL